MYKMTASCLLILFAVLGFVKAQTSSQIRDRLGKATSETYRLERGITVRADYDGEGEICLLQMSGRYFDISKLSEELVPMKTRGRELERPKSTSPATNYSSSAVYEYERVRMHVSISGDNGSLRFIFKGRRCAEKSAISGTSISPGGNLPASNNFVPVPTTPKPEVKIKDSRNWYGKYETTQPAVITELPLPELTPEAVSEFTPGEMVVDVILGANGEPRIMGFRGYLRKGMGDRVKVAAGKIKFTPALLDGRAVPQRATIKYGIKKCDDGKTCTYVLEFVE